MRSRRLDYHDDYVVQPEGRVTVTGRSVSPNLFLGVNVKRFIPLVAMLVACTSSPLPEGAQGLWGGPGIQVVVGASQVEVDFSCNSGVAPGPLVVDSAGRFTLVASVTRAAAPTLVDTIAGRIDADTMTMDFSSAPNPDFAQIQRYTARRGVSTNFGVARACP